MAVPESLQKRNWKNGLFGGTPLEEDRLNALEQDLAEALVQLARDPSQLFAGSVTYNSAGAPTSAVVQWPDKENGQPITGTYSGTASSAFPGSINAYTITRILNAGIITVTQPTVTRNSTTGEVTNRPPITIT